MMAHGKMDGAGAVKMSTLNDAHLHIARVHGLVEQMAMAQKREQSTQVLGMQLRRAATPLVGMLKGHFSSMADIVSGMILVATRAGNEGAKVRSLREMIGSLKSQLEISTNKVKEQHTIEDDTPTD
jgi:hypothetical protein